MEIALIYIGDGYIPGIPARDLTRDEVKQYGGIKFLLATGLYQKPNEALHEAQESEK